jgi:hypothetical protein
LAFYVEIKSQASPEGAQPVQLDARGGAPLAFVFGVHPSAGGAAQGVFGLVFIEIVEQDDGALASGSLTADDIRGLL